MKKIRITVIIFLILGGFIGYICGKSYIDKGSQDVDLMRTECNHVEQEIIDEDDIIRFTVLNGETLEISEDRVKDEIYGISRLDNRWTLEETDKILSSLKGTWKVDEYVGFVVASIYYADLFDPNDNLPENERNSLVDAYAAKVEGAKNNIPDVFFSIKEYEGNMAKGNYLYVNGNYHSPISIILSLERTNDNYPVFVEQTTISSDFFVEYPVMYINFFIYREKRYEPATLVISTDKQYYILIDGAFYSLKYSEDVNVNDTIH